jgi:cell division protein FtsI (penicillin-binding protein 3)
MNVFKLNQEKSLTPHFIPDNSASRKLDSSKLARKNYQVLVRFTLIWLVLIAGAGALGWRLHRLQIERGEELKEKAERQQTYNFRPYIPRRSIVDAYDNVIATDKVVYSFYIHPSMLSQPRELVVEKLAEIFPDKQKNEIIKQLNSRETGVLFAKTISEEQAERIRNLKWDGIDLESRYARFYPQDQLVADVIGYVDTDHRGQAGLEHSQEKLIERDLSTVEIKSMLQVRKNGNGEIIPAQLPPGLVELDDLKLKLTLDLRLQRSVRDSLAQQVKHYQAKRGTAIVMDVNTGAILALVCYPTYDPNQYYNFDFALYKNWAVADTYEPGSTFKPLNIAIALDAGVIEPYTRVNDTGHIVIDRWPISNAMKTGAGWINITQVLEKSSNVGMIQIMRRMDKNKYYDHLQALGLGGKMKIDLPFEASGYLKGREIFTARAIEPAVSSFGQGLSLTPLKLVQLHAALANGGKLVTPHVVEGLVNAQGEIKAPSPVAKNPSPMVFSTESAHDVVKMMESVVANGTGKVAHIDGYHIGGKTGTAQKHNDRGGYMANAKITSFVGILPTNQPRYVILVAVDEPKGANTYGSTVAAPVVKEIMKSIISLTGLPPSYPIKQSE